jgi:5-methylcytosine-specific restriction endonuclease McrA
VTDRIVLPGWASQLSQPDRTRLTLAIRDGRWECAYCTQPLVPVYSSYARRWRPARVYDWCPGGEHVEMPCWHGGTYAAVPGYCWPEIEHVVPRARGGSDALDNLVLACFRCNARKGARLLEELPDDWARRPAWRGPALPPGPLPALPPPVALLPG